MTVITRKRSENFAVIPNAVAEDTRISFEARGVLCYLLAKPNDWQVHVKDIQRAGPVGRDKAYRIITELKEAGYLERVVRRDTCGKIVENEYIVYDDPVPSSLPFPEKPDVAKPLPENPEMVKPLPEKPYPDRPDTANQDGYINTQLNKIPPLPPRGRGNDPQFRRLLESWAKHHRPDNVSSAEQIFLSLPADIDRSRAFECALLYQRIQILRGRKPKLINYLREKAWRNLIGAPDIDSEGRFVITPDREEWPSWIEAIRAQYGDSAVETSRRHKKILRPDRWSPMTALAHQEALL